MNTQTQKQPESDDLGTPKNKRRANKVNYSTGSLGVNLTTYLRSEAWSDPKTGEFEEPKIRFIAQSIRFKNKSGYPVDINLSLDLNQLLAFRKHIEDVIDFVETTGYEPEDYTKDEKSIKDLIEQFK